MSHQRIAVAGASGLVGRATAAVLEAAGHEVVPMSRSHGVDLVAGTGLAAALAQVQCVIDVTNTPDTDPAAARAFFDFAAMVVGWTRNGDAAGVPPLLVQPVAVDDVAAALADLAAERPVNGTVEIAGPESHDLVDMARRTLAARDDPTDLIASWHGIFGPDMAGEVLLPGTDARTGPTTFQAWLATQTPQPPGTD